MDSIGPIAGALAVAAVVLLLLTFIESNVLLLRARPWEGGDRSLQAAPAADWVRGHLGEFAVADLTVRTAATIVLVSSAVDLASRLALVMPAPRPAAAAAAALLITAAVQAAGYLGAAATGALPNWRALLAARILTYALWPLAALVVRMARRPARRVPSPGAREEAGNGHARELEEWVEEVARSGSLEEPERQMVRGVLELGDTTAREVMVPRLDIVALSVDTPLDEVVRTAITSGFSRIPLYEGTLDHIIGIIYTKDLLALQQAGAVIPDLRQIARPPYIIPETKKIRDLLQDFRQSRVHMAIVVDEYGGTAGLVTIEDLLEEIVGEIEDEYDRQPQEAQVVRLSDDVALVDARLSIEDFNELFHLSLNAEDYDTVGGFVYTHLGKIPIVGDRVAVNGIVLSVESTAGRRIKRLRVVRLPQAPPVTSATSA